MHSFPSSDEQNQEELNLLLKLLPERIQSAVHKQNNLNLLEIVMDLGRQPELRFRKQAPLKLDTPVTQEEIDFITNNLGGFTSENRAGIERTLHRISAIRNQKGKIIGLTCRVGRTLTGTIELEEEFLGGSQSVLILGPPGSGKTSKLREIAYLYAEDLQKRVVIIDTSMEIAGAGDIPHASIGRARRMPVINPEEQHKVMIEAVENHTPEVIIIDEISTEEEARAAQTIAERGVILIATAHGRDLESIVKNPSLAKLVGEPETVTLSDEEAKKRRTQKNVLERTRPSYFQTVVEIISFNSIIVHTEVDHSVDQILRSEPCIYAEVRHKKPSTEEKLKEIPLEIYPYAVSHSLIEEVVDSLELKAHLVHSPEQANLIICLDDYAEHDAKICKFAHDENILLKTIKTNNFEAVKCVLESARILLNQNDKANESDNFEEKIALEEVEKAVHEHKINRSSVELSPRKENIRNLQIDFIQKHNLSYEVVGEGNNKRIVINE